MISSARYGYRPTLEIHSGAVPSNTAATTWAGLMRGARGRVAGFVMLRVGSDAEARPGYADERGRPQMNAVRQWQGMASPHEEALPRARPGILYGVPRS